MTTHGVAGFLLIWLAATSNAQSRQASSPSIQTVAPEKSDNPTVLVGCVVADEANADLFTLSDNKAGVTYLLSGTKLDAYTGHRVRIIGGLYPSANIAAQAGGIDPTKAAIAATTAKVPETATAVPRAAFRVRQVQPLKGSCAPPQRK